MNDKKGEQYLDKLIEDLNVIVGNRNALIHGLGLMPDDDEPEGDFFILKPGKKHIGYQTSINHVMKEYLGISQIATAFAHAGSKISKGKPIATSLRAGIELRAPVNRLRPV